MRDRPKRIVFARWIIAMFAGTSLLLSGDFAPLLGRWTGEAIPRGSFLPHAAIIIDLTIASDGEIRGTVGDAVIVAGSFRRFSQGIPRLFTHADYVLDLTLQGDLIKSAGIQRAQLKMYATQIGPALQAFAATDGSKLYPGASTETMKSKMRIQTHRFMLKRAT